MEFDRVSMKQRAKQLMSQTKPSPWRVGIIISILSLIYSTIYIVLPSNTIKNVTICIIIIIILELLFSFIRTSIRWYGLKITRMEETEIADLFLAFKEKTIKVFVVNFIKGICQTLGLFIFWIGILFPLYWFRFAVYCIKDQEEISVIGALKASMNLLKGHYIELIKLDISNLGWNLLSYLTLGIANFYVKPYLLVQYAEFYDYIKGQKELIR